MQSIKTTAVLLSLLNEAPTRRAIIVDRWKGRRPYLAVMHSDDFELHHERLLPVRAGSEADALLTRARELAQGPDYDAIDALPVLFVGGEAWVLPAHLMAKHARAATTMPRQ